MGTFKATLDALLDGLRLVDRCLFGPQKRRDAPRLRYLADRQFAQPGGPLLPPTAMTTLSRTMQIMLDEARGVGRTNLIWYLTAEAQTQLELDIAPYAVPSFGGKPKYPEFGGAPLWIIGARATHGFWVILGDVESEWAIGLTPTFEIRECLYAD